MIALRDARPTDAGSIGGILSEFVDTTDWMPRLHSRAEDVAHAGALIERGGVIVAEVAGRVEGFAALHGGDLDALYVGAPARGQGVGTALLGKLKACAPHLRLWTLEANGPAQAFYRKHGFIETARGDGAGTDEGLPDVRFEWHPARAGAKTQEEAM